MPIAAAAAQNAACRGTRRRPSTIASVEAFLRSRAVAACSAVVARWLAWTLLLFIGLWLLDLRLLDSQWGMRICTFNPATLVMSARLALVSQTLRKQDLVGLPGTQMACLKDEEGRQRRVHRQRLDGRQWVHFPRTRGHLTNKSAGVSLLIGPRLGKCDITCVRFPPASVGGRGGTLRLVSRNFDLKPIVLYFPPRPTTADAEKKYRETVDILLRFFESELNKAPARCTPLVFVDLNDGLGIRTLDGQQVVSQGGVVGTLAPKLEHYAGERFREICEAHHIALANTHKGGEDTWYGEKCSSRIDYVGLPLGLLGGLLSCKALALQARHMQLARSKRLWDHLPVEVCFRYGLPRPPKFECLGSLASRAFGSVRLSLEGKVGDAHRGPA